MIRITTLALAMLPVLAMAQEADEHVAEFDGVRVLHAWTNATADNAQVYMQIENTRDDAVTLTGAETDIARLVTLVGSSIKAGDPTVAETIDAVPVAAQTDVALEPGGLYLMLADLEADLEEGQHFPITVQFDPIGSVTVEVDVLAAESTHHPHAGHAH